MYRSSRNLKLAFAVPNKDHRSIACKRISLKNVEIARIARSTRQKVELRTVDYARKMLRSLIFRKAPCLLYFGQGYNLAPLFESNGIRISVGHVGNPNILPRPGKALRLLSSLGRAFFQEARTFLAEPESREKLGNIRQMMENDHAGPEIEKEGKAA